MVPALPLTKEEAKARVEAVVVGREVKQARRDRLSKEGTRPEESMDSMVQGKVNNNTVTPEGRHRLSGDPWTQGGGRKAVEWGVQEAEEGPLTANPKCGRVCVRGGSQGSVGEGHGSGNSHQINVGEEPSTSRLVIIPEHRHVGQEQEINPAGPPESTVRSTISKNLVFIKGPCPPRPGRVRCDVPKMSATLGHPGLPAV